MNPSFGVSNYDREDHAQRRDAHGARRARKKSRRLTALKWTAASFVFALALAFGLMQPFSASGSHAPPPLPLTAPVPTECDTADDDLLTNLAIPPDRRVSGSDNRTHPGTLAPDAVWANATAFGKQTVLQISGQNLVIDGRVVSRSHMLLASSNNQYRHGTEYGLRSNPPNEPAFDLSGALNCFSGPDPDGAGTLYTPGAPNQVPRPTPAQPAGFPVNFDPDGDGIFHEHFAPGSPAAVAANTAGQYYTCPHVPGTSAVTAPLECIEADGILKTLNQNAVIDTGLYYVAGPKGQVDVSASNVDATVTFVSTGAQHVSGSVQATFTAYTSNLLFMSEQGVVNSEAGDGESAMEVSGGTSFFRGGHIFAPKGRVELSGSNNSFFCTVMGDRVTLSGSEQYISNAECAAPTVVTEIHAVIPGNDHSDLGDGASTIELGTAIHDKVVVSSTSGSDLTGDIIVRRFDNGTCAGDAAATATFEEGDGLGNTYVSDDVVTLDSVLAFTPASTGLYSFQATYQGDDDNPGPVVGKCEGPVRVVDAKISIAASATNEVGDPHTFTVTVHQDSGDGLGFVLATVGNVDVTLSNSNGAGFVLDAGASSCDDFQPAGDNLNASGQCITVFTSPDAGQVTGNASVTLEIAGLTVTRSTDDVAPNSGPAVKTFVDAEIALDPLVKTNEVGDPHTVTVTVKQNDGSGGGFVAAPVGHVDFTLADGFGSAFVIDAAGTTCDEPGDNLDDNGQCKIVFTSPSAGQVTINATATLTVGGVTLTRDTDPATANVPDGPSGTGPATKNFADANITIAANDTNEVGQPHTFTVTVQADDGGAAGLVAATDGNVDVTLTDSNGAVNVLDAALSTCDEGQPDGDNLDASGQCTVVFTSASAGKVTGNATVTLTIGGLTVVRDTDPATGTIGAGPGGSGPAVKTFVDAEIALDPLTATNEVGDPHTVTVTVRQNDGEGGGFVTAPVGHVDFTLADGNGSAFAIDALATTCDELGDNLDDNGQCKIVFTSPSAGQVTINATVTLTVGGLSLTRDTDPATANVPDGPSGTGPATKNFADANITIAANDTNEVGQPHTFTVTVQADDGGAAGLVAATDGNVDVTLTDSNGAVNVLDAALSTCDEGQPDGDNLDASGQCTVVFTSASAGKVTGNATVTLTIGGLTVVRDTDPATGTIGAGPGGSGPAVKTFVDAEIALDPLTATNEVGDPHTVTVTVRQNDGEGGGFVAAPVGHVVFTLADGFGSAFVIDAAGTTCDELGDNLDASGQCKIVFTSPSAGQVTINATVTLTVGGLSLTRDTDPATANVPDGPSGTGPATKNFADANITIAANDTNEVGQPHTFTVTVQADDGGAAGLVAATDGNVDVTLTDSNGAVNVLDAALSTCDEGQPDGDNLDASGQCTVVFTSASAGKVTGNATVTLTIGGLTVVRDTDPATGTIGAGPGGSGPAVKTFVDAEIALDPLTATNEVGDPHTVTVTVRQNDGEGGGFVTAPVGHVDFTLADGNGSAFAIDALATTCDELGDNLDDNGQCKIVFTSPSAGQVTINATVTLTVGGLSLTRDTDPTTANVPDGPNGTGPATKTFVNARILLDPLTSTNPTGAPHTVTVTVQQNAGDGLGFVAATIGNVDVTLSNSGGAVAVLDTAASTCDDDQPDGDNLDASGQCIVVFTSATAGTTTINATVTLVVGGVSLTRDTDPATLDVGAGPGGTGPATKNWVAGGATLLIIDEDSIDNGIHFNPTGGLITPDGPDFFEKLEVNDDRPGTKQRAILRYFAAHVGETITVKTGQTGDEGWFAPTCIPQKWISGSSNTCVTDSALRQTAINNYFGKSGSSAIPSQSRLDKIPAVMPLRALGLNALVNKNICAVVYDSDISINYDKSTFPFTSGNLQGETLGIVAFTVNQTRTLDGFSSSTLPQVTLTITDASACSPTELFNAPVPESSSVPNDRIAPGSPSGYRQLLTHPALPLFF